MNIQKEVSVPAMTVLPEIHPVKFVSSAVHPTNTLSTVFVESVWWEPSTTVNSKHVCAKMDGTKTIKVCAKKEMMEIVAQEPIYRHRIAVFLVVRDANNVQA